MSSTQLESSSDVVSVCNRPLCYVLTSGRSIGYQLVRREQRTCELEATIGFDVKPDQVHKEEGKATYKSRMLHNVSIPKHLFAGRQ